MSANKNSANYSQHTFRSNHISFSILCVLCLGWVSLIFQFCFTAISLQIWTCDFYFILFFWIYYTADFKHHKCLNFWDDNHFFKVRVILTQQEYLSSIHIPLKSHIYSIGSLVNSILENNTDSFLDVLKGQIS